MVVLMTMAVVPAVQAAADSHLSAWSIHGLDVAAAVEAYIRHTASTGSAVENLILVKDVSGWVIPLCRKPGPLAVLAAQHSELPGEPPALKQLASLLLSSVKVATSVTEFTEVAAVARAEHAAYIQYIAACFAAGLLRGCAEHSPAPGQLHTAAARSHGVAGWLMVLLRVLSASGQLLQQLLRVKVQGLSDDDSSSVSSGCAADAAQQVGAQQPAHVAAVARHVLDTMHKHIAVADKCLKVEALRHATCAHYTSQQQQQPGSHLAAEGGEPAGPILCDGQQGDMHLLAEQVLQCQQQVRQVEAALLEARQFVEAPAETQDASSIGDSSSDSGSSSSASCMKDRATVQQLLRAQQDSSMQQLPKQLQACAALLCAQLPVRFCCNNPGCTNWSQASEVLLVGGKGCVCAGCKTSR